MKNSCYITRLWPCVEDMKKDLFIDLEKQEIIRLSTGNKLHIRLGKKKEKKENKYYYVVSFWKNKKTYQFLVHRLFFYWHYEYLPKLVDHKDTNPQNNKIENLRELTDSENQRNSHKRKNASSKYKGVSWVKKRKKWVAQFTTETKQIFLGYFDDENEAGQAYNDAIRKFNFEKVSIFNDTPQEKARRNNQFDPLPKEMNHIKVLFQDIEPLVDLK